MRLVIGVTAFAWLAQTSMAASFFGVANGVHSSGFDPTNTIFSGLVGGQMDAHYALIKVPTGCSGSPCTKSLADGGGAFGPGAYVVLGPAPTYPFNGTWLANDAGSMWIGPRSDQRDPSDPGAGSQPHQVFASDTDFYVYRMVFNLSLLGLLPNTAQINLGWLSDNRQNFSNSAQSHIRLCAIATQGDTTPCAAGSTIAGSTNAGEAAGSLTTINIQHGVNNANFAAGWLALDFIVYNAELPAFLDNPSGLRVQINSATADIDASVPEPATLGMMGAALIGLGLIARKKKVR